jgi:hypothetical protein
LLSCGSIKGLTLQHVAREERRGYEERGRESLALCDVSHNDDDDDDAS